MGSSPIPLPIALPIAVVIAILTAILTGNLPSVCDVSAPESVPELDIDRYAGRWYEIYRSAFISTTFERGCDCVIANYTLLEDEKDSTPYVRVFNHCELSPGGQVSEIVGRADILDPEAPAELAVSFGSGQARSPNYYVIALDEDDGPDAPYSVALVGSVPCRLSLWILARDPNLAEDDERIDALFAIAQEQGYATDRIGMTRTFQGDTCAYF